MGKDDERSSRDQVLRELREIKEQLAAAHGFDVRRMLAEARANQAKGRRKIIPAPVRQKA